MTELTVPELPLTPGAYRWFYADVSAGDLTCVIIFMVGSLFSPRYVARSPKGALPIQHSAVNLAFYRRGVREAWVLSEYPDATRADARTLRIGRSSLRYHDHGAIELSVEERTAPWGRPIEAKLWLTPRTKPMPPQALDEGGRHHWSPLALHADATFEVPTFGCSAVGRGYHDSNFGEEPLGVGLAQWRWTRWQLPEETRVRYEVQGAEVLNVVAGEGSGRVERAAGDDVMGAALTPWRLRVPRRIPFEGKASVVPTLLESSPFYARLEARAGGIHALTEVADFRRFRSPFVRWMAHFRTRVETAA